MKWLESEACIWYMENLGYCSKCGVVHRIKGTFLEEEEK
tara:strand:+ start:520 stop:636 length:117 start_codon:yes stop_codon:yes gene_type:complete